MLCSEAILVNQAEKEGHAAVLRCKRWSCELCNPYNHRRIKRACREGRPNSFLTLTCDPQRYETPDQAARDLKRAWVNLRRSMERELGIAQPPFIAIFESTKEGWPHLHICLRMKYVPQEWISETMGRLNGAPVCWIERIQNVKKVAAYVAKYISKAPEAFKGCKRWWRSHDYEVDKEECEPFKIYSAHVSQINKRMAAFIYERRNAGWIVEVQGHDYCTYSWPRPSLGEIQAEVRNNTERLMREGYFG